MTKTKQKPQTPVRSTRLVLCDHAASRSPYCAKCTHGKPHGAWVEPCCETKPTMCKARRIKCQCKAQNSEVSSGATVPEHEF
jgi:hypothetical protein